MAVRKRKRVAESSQSFVSDNEVVKREELVEVLVQQKESEPSAKQEDCQNCESKDKLEEGKVHKVKRENGSAANNLSKSTGMPLQPRTMPTKLLLGAHVSGAKGIENAILNAKHIGANAFAMFLKNQRRWSAPELASDSITRWHELCASENYVSRRQVVPHGSYLVNLAQADEDKAAQAYAAFVDDLHRAEALDIGLFNFHPGSYSSCTLEQGISNVAHRINQALSETKFVKILVENTAGQGALIGATFEHLSSIIDKVADKTRVGVCLDTCHMFAAGYDIRTQAAYDATMREFDRIVGHGYLSAWHVNDSRVGLGENRDLHALIGHGYIGLEAFRVLVNDPRNAELPMILETPATEDVATWAEEIKLLEKLVGMREDDEFVLETARRLQQLGQADREIQRKTAERKREKMKKRQ